MAKAGRPTGYRVPSLYKHFKGKFPTLVSLLAEQNIGKRELIRMIKARPDTAWNIFMRPMGSMRFKHLVSLAIILDKTPGEVADIIYKELDKANLWKFEQGIKKAKEETQRNRELNNKNQKEHRAGNKQKGWDYEI